MKSSAAPIGRVAPLSDTRTMRAPNASCPRRPRTRIMREKLMNRTTLDVLLLVLLLAWVF
jgi:hypothetical protein